jgi:hypothetical protein
LDPVETRRLFGMSTLLACSRRPLAAIRSGGRAGAECRREGLTPIPPARKMTPACDLDLSAPLQNGRLQR